MDLDLRFISEDDLWAAQETVAWAFGTHPEREMTEHLKPAFEYSRGLGAFEGEHLVGFTLVYPLQLTVPGARSDVAFLDSVAVRPTHRRRGMLTTMMKHLLNDFHERGETMSMLGASESIIYGRYGYGIASWQVDYSIDRHHTGFASERNLTGTFRFVDKDEARELFPIVEEKACGERPGYMRGAPSLWDFYLLDRPEWRQGASAFFYVVYEIDGEVQGYVTYRLNRDKLFVHELISVTDESHEALWRYCFGVDLRKVIEAPKRPIDDPLPLKLADPRRLRQSVRDDLWLRLVEVKAALERRTYYSEGEVVLEIDDESCPWNRGRYLLSGGPEGGRCRKTTRSPDLTLGSTEIAAAYLGGTTLTSLASAGRVSEGTQGALRRADDMFRSEVLPWWPNEF